MVIVEEWMPKPLDKDNIKHCNVSIYNIDVQPRFRKWFSKNDLNALERIMHMLRVWLHVQVADKNNRVESGFYSIGFNEIISLF